MKNKSFCYTILEYLLIILTALFVRKHGQKKSLQGLFSTELLKVEHALVFS